MASPFKQNKKARRRARRSLAKSAKNRESWEDRPEILASIDRLNERALGIAHAKRVQNKRFTPIKKTPAQLEEMKERLRSLGEQVRKTKASVEALRDLLRS